MKGPTAWADENPELRDRDDVNALVLEVQRDAVEHCRVLATRPQATGGWVMREPADDEKPIAVIDRGYMGDQNAWCYWDDEYPEEGSCGPFETYEAAMTHAMSVGYDVLEPSE